MFLPLLNLWLVVVVGAGDCAAGRPAPAWAVFGSLVVLGVGGAWVILGAVLEIGVPGLGLRHVCFCVLFEGTLPLYYI